MPRLPGARGDRDPAAPRGVLPPSISLTVFRTQVETAIGLHDGAEDDRILVAVSGGKDSLALWDVLLDLGYDADGPLSRPRDRRVLGPIARGRPRRSPTRGAPAAHRRPRTRPRLRHPHRGQAAASRSTCAVCGLSKRYVFNRAALEGGFDVVATGHNLDDEAATLLGNTLRWQTESIARQARRSRRATAW